MNLESKRRTKYKVGEKEELTREERERERGQSSNSAVVFSIRFWLEFHTMLQEGEAPTP